MYAVCIHTPTAHQSGILIRRAPGMALYYCVSIKRIHVRLTMDARLPRELSVYLVVIQQRRSEHPGAETSAGHEAPQSVRVCVICVGHPAAEEIAELRLVIS